MILLEINILFQIIRHEMEDDDDDDDDDEEEEVVI